MRRTVIIGVGLLVVITAAWWFLFMAGKSSDISDLNDQTEAAKTQELTLQARRDSLQALAAQEGEFRVGLSELRNSIPVFPDGATLIENLNDAALSADVDLLSLSPQFPVASVVPGLFEISIDMAFEGPYFNVLPLLSELENLPRLMRVDTINIGSTTLEDGTNLLSVSLTAVAFSLTDLEGSLAEAAS